MPARKDDWVYVRGYPVLKMISRFYGVPVAEAGQAPVRDNPGEGRVVQASPERTAMARQNRVTPFGEIVAVAERGTVMGNRGVLHDRAGRIRAALAGEAVAPLPPGVPREAAGRHGPGPLHRTLLSRRGDRAGGRTPPLFRVPPEVVPFLCQRLGERKPGMGRPTASMIDERLHAERVGPGRSKRTFRAAVADLPDGVFVTVAMEGTCPSCSGRAAPRLVARRLHGEPHCRRDAGRSGAHAEIDNGAIRAGYVPEVHPSVQGPQPSRPTRVRPPSSRSTRCATSKHSLEMNRSIDHGVSNKAGL